MFYPVLLPSRSYVLPGPITPSFLCSTRSYYPLVLMFYPVLLPSRSYVLPGPITPSFTARSFFFSRALSSLRLIQFSPYIPVSLSATSSIFPMVGLSDFSRAPGQVFVRPVVLPGRHSGATLLLLGATSSFRGYTSSVFSVLFQGSSLLNRLGFSS